MLKSKIDMNEKVKNKDRKFGSNLYYYPVLINKGDGELSPALLTENEINNSIDRANRNKEDLPTNATTQTFWEAIFN